MKKIVMILATALFLQAGTITNSIGMKFVEIPSGYFMMGTATRSTADCPKDDPFTSKNEYKDCVAKRTNGVQKSETPQHKVHIKSFYMATTEVTQLQWYKVMGNNPAAFKKEKLGYDSRNNPVENVSYNDIKRFIRKLNKKENTDRYFLPTEAQWEYAARAGTTTAYSFGDDKGNLGSYAWYYGNSGNRTHPVAQKRPNKWGLYDVHGNVYEWTSSCYTENYNKGCYRYSDGTIPKVLRGGCWGNIAVNSRSASRSDDRPGSRVDCSGFRLSKTKYSQNF